MQISTGDLTVHNEHQVLLQTTKHLYIFRRSFLSFTHLLILPQGSRFYTLTTEIERPQIGELTLEGSYNLVYEEG